MLYCFLDTNIFLQFKTFDEISWDKILGVKEVCLVVPMTVIRELDKFKTDPNSDRRRKRSRSALSKIESYGNAGQDSLVRRGVYLRVTEDPLSSWLQENGYDPIIADDRIVGTLHFFKEQNPQTEALLITDDTGPRLKAKSRGINSQTLPDDMRLSDESDPLQKEIQQLQHEVQRLTYLQPKLVMKFEGEEDDFSTILDFQIDFEEIQFVNDEIEQKLRLEFDYLKYDDLIDGEVSTKNDIFSLMGLAGTPALGTIYPSREEVNRYHQLLDKFIQNEYRDYLKQSEVYENLERCTRPLKLILENEGTSPAKNVDVWLYFPDGIEIFEKSHVPPFEPPPPQKPKNRSFYDSILGTQITSSPLFSPYNLNNFSRESSRPSISIRKTNSYEIKWGSVDLKHNDTHPLPELYLLFDPIDGTSTGYEIAYKITADNVPDVVEGKLTIRVHRI